MNFILSYLTAAQIYINGSLLIVDFYQIPYVFEGILPILINLGFILLPIFLLATLVWRFHLKSAEEEYDLARLAMLEDVYERINKLKD